MDINQKFAIFCARRCLHLWKAPKKVIKWLDNPTQEKAYGAAKAAERAAERAADAVYGSPDAIYASENTAAAESAYIAARATYTAADAVHVAAHAVDKSEDTASEAVAIYVAAYVAVELDTTVDVLKHEFMTTLSNDELNIADSKWIEYATVEIFNRVD